ncbi:MAG TPA: c-type cytochrome [Thermodesulfobacteriota bacterium]|nr:c-type cytochrome [Thermodesulfobacteriota bacterium]
MPIKIRTTVFYFISLAIFVLAASLFSPRYSGARNPDPSIEFQISGKPLKAFKLSALKSKIEPRRIELYDIEYGKIKRYEGFALGDILGLGFGENLKSGEYTDVAFIALDGYNAVAALSDISKPGGYIVYADLDSGKWEPVGKQGIDPGPFYLVWTGKEETPENEYPWSWQIAAVNLMRFQDQYPLVFPKGAAADSPAYRGYGIFKARCVKCHSMNGQGGKVGPDLNAPKSIVEYRPAHMIKEFIKHPSQYRYTRMPDHPDLSESGLDNLLAYFHYMKEIRD